MQAIAEAIREQILSILSYIDPNDDIKELVHNTILDHCGLLQKREELDDDLDYTEEEAQFHEEIKLQRQEEEAETFRLFTEEETYKQRLKNVALFIGASAGGWFGDEDDED
ncbi:unnamed protein product [Cylicocyclus nassatus]|uniref:Uncharacterized protein n=1 Tax=Cylicocyclus nassatus TaxID=53992 RepID=A0AA36MGY5_CYLNA|nr:unnamed protein product [Cylicocyclus nassatus]